MTVYATNRTIATTKANAGSIDGYLAKYSSEGNLLWMVRNAGTSGNYGVGIALDLSGNMKEDIEARSLCDKLKVPTQIITKEIYDKVIDKIDQEKERLSSDDRLRREKLLDDTMRAQQVFIDNMNFDDLNYNQDFMHELCVILNV